MYNQALETISKKVRPQDFVEPIHSEIFEICSKLIEAGKTANPLTVTAFLPSDLMIGEFNLKQYVARLARVATIPSQIGQIAEMVRDLADKRRLRDTFREGIQILETAGSDIDLIGTQAFDALDEVLTPRTVQNSPSLSIRASVVRSVDAAAKAYQNDGAIVGLSYGLRDLDQKTGGLHKGELTVIGARPGQGKTMLALNFARALGSEQIDSQTGEVLKAAYRGVFFSLEMGDILLTQRLMSDMIFGHGYEVPYSRIRRGAISEIEFGYLRSAAHSLAEMPLQIEQQGGMTLAQVGSKMRQMKRKHGLDYGIVDYMQLMSVADRYKGNRVSEVTELSNGLLRLAKDLDVALVALCQLNRSVESRDDKRPNLSDLRETGAIEQDASVVMMLHRKAYYLQNREPKPGTLEYEKWQLEMVECLHKLDIGVEKNRNGSSGSVEVYCNPAVNAVRDLSSDHAR